MSKVVLECNNICKIIKGKNVVDNVSFSLREGDIMGFIGPNGAGKTSVIKSILGLYKLSSGNIKICGYDINNNYVNAIKNVGAIIENPDMYMYMSGYDNLMISAYIYNVSISRVEEIIKLVNLDKRIYDKVNTYSLGMRQRLGIAQAIIHNPKLLILDEPTNGLDPEGIMELKILLKKLAGNGMGIIVSSHILSELESFCNMVCIINKGSVINYADLDKLIYLSSGNYVLELSSVNVNKYLDNYNIIDDNHIKINVDSKKLNVVIKNLVNNNISIYEIKREVLSLEEIFMSLVGGNTID